MFKFSKKLAFGLDLSDLSLKIAQLKEKKGEISLASFIKESIPVGLVVGGEIKREEELVKILKETLEKAKGEPLGDRRVVCNLPEEKVFIRVIQLPPMKETEIDQAVTWEAENHIPLSIEEVYLDWQIIKPVYNHLDHLDILIAATPRPLVDSYSNVLRESGLEPVALEPESIAVVNSLISPKDPKPTIIVDLGLTGTNFVIFSAKAIRFTSHITLSGQILSQAIMKNLAVDGEKASQLKIKIGLDKTKKKGKVYQALEPRVNELAKQIQDYISFYHNHATHIHGPDGTIAQVLLCGGESLLLNLPSFLSEKLKLPVHLGDPLINISPVKKQKRGGPSKRASLSKRDSLSYTTAIGLALREVQ